MSIAFIPRKIATLIYTKIIVISVHINGSVQIFERPITISELVAALNLTGKKMAVECNNEIVPRSLFSLQLLADGDKIEVVVAVGGG